MATAAQITFAEVEASVPWGFFDPDAIHTPGNHLDRIVKSTINGNRVEFRTVCERSAA